MEPFLQLSNHRNFIHLSVAMQSCVNLLAKICWQRISTVFRQSSGEPPRLLLQSLSSAHLLHLHHLPIITSSRPLRLPLPVHHCIQVERWNPSLFHLLLRCTHADLLIHHHATGDRTSLRNFAVSFGLRAMQMTSAGPKMPKGEMGTACYGSASFLACRCICFLGGLLVMHVRRIDYVVLCTAERGFVTTRRDVGVSTRHIRTTQQCLHGLVDVTLGAGHFKAASKLLAALVLCAISVTMARLFFGLVPNATEAWHALRFLVTANVLVVFCTLLIGTIQVLFHCGVLVTRRASEV
mmetsp:Transcript_104970/g.186710  ORF Transcript_104970/g.186710 Transcript_104970/m.186710 type:complete len:295 (-) Transcript_104970:315-1199(-)